jgi:hypothetical protein
MLLFELTDCQFKGRSSAALLRRAWLKLCLLTRQYDIVHWLQAEGV